MRLEIKNDTYKNKIKKEKDKKYIYTGRVIH